MLTHHRVTRAHIARTGTSMPVVTGRSAESLMESVVIAINAPESFGCKDWTAANVLFRHASRADWASGHRGLCQSMPTMGSAIPHTLLEIRGHAKVSASRMRCADNSAIHPGG